MKKILYLIIILALLAIVFPALSRNSEFNSLTNSLWSILKDFSTWIIAEVGKLIKLIPHKK